MTAMKKNEILPVVLGAATACIILAAAAILFMDTAIRVFAPGIYMGGRLANTYNELKKEKSDMDSFFTQGIMISDNMTAQLSGTFDNIGFDFNGRFNKAIPKLYMEGNAVTDGKSYAVQLFSENNVTGVCLPEYSDAWLCRENSSLTAYAASAFGADGNSNVLNAAYPALQDMLKEIKISGYSKKNSGISEYRVYTSGAAGKKALSDILSAITEDRLKNIDTADMVREYSDSLDFPETIAFSVYERNKCVVYASCSFNLPDGNMKIWVDMSEKARLRDSVDCGIMIAADGSEYGFSYKSSGNHFFRNENLSDETEIEISLPLLDKTLIKAKTEFKNSQNLEFSLNASNEKLFTAELSGTGTYRGESFAANADRIYLSFGRNSHSGSGSISLESADGDFSVPQKERYTMDTAAGELSTIIKNLTEGGENSNE